MTARPSPRQIAAGLPHAHALAPGRGAPARPARRRAGARPARRARRDRGAAAGDGRHRGLRARAAAARPAHARDGRDLLGAPADRRPARYLRALANPLDEQALYSALASPLAGSRATGSRCSPSRCVARSRVGDGAGAYPSSRSSQLSEPDRRAVASLLRVARARAPRRARARDLRADRARDRATAATARTCWRSTGASAGSPTSTSCCAWRAASRRAKGATCAPSWTTSRTCRRAEAIEPEAPVEGVEPDAVRLMSIHAAKGLEFPVVCVADLGRQPLVRAAEAARRRRARRSAPAARGRRRCARRRSTTRSCAASDAGARPRRRTASCTWR